MSKQCSPKCFFFFVFVPFLLRSAQNRIRKKLAVEKEIKNCTAHRQIQGWESESPFSLANWQCFPSPWWWVFRRLSRTCATMFHIGKIAEWGSACREKRHLADFARPAMELRHCAASWGSWGREEAAAPMGSHRSSRRKLPKLLHGVAGMLRLCRGHAAVPPCQPLQAPARSTTAASSPGAGSSARPSSSVLPWSLPRPPRGCRSARPPSPPLSAPGECWWFSPVHLYSGD
jgi:hypothetical protein